MTAEEMYCDLFDKYKNMHSYAILRDNHGYIIFEYNDQVIRFMTSSHL